MCRESVCEGEGEGEGRARVVVLPIGAAGGRCNTVRREEKGRESGARGSIQSNKTYKKEKRGDTLGRKYPARSNYRL